MTVGVVVATFGDLDFWGPLARRAIASVDAQTVPVPVTWIHGESLAAARNEGVEVIGTDWVIICDADDELDSSYVESMLAAEGDIRRPSTLGFWQSGAEDDHPVMIPIRDIRTSNYIVIGAMFRRDTFMRVGGFDASLSCVEDWDFWIKMIMAGEVVVECPAAIYRVGVDLVPKRRNSDSELHQHFYTVIFHRYKDKW